MRLFLAFILVLFGCAEIDPRTSSENGVETKTIEPASIPGFDANEFTQVQFFEKWASGQVPAAEKKDWIHKCKNDPHSHLFCSSMRADKFYVERLERALPPPPSTTPRVVQLPEIVFAKGKVKNWRKLRKEKISLLVKAMEKLTPEENQAIIKLAQSEKRCPNNWAGAAAARLEDTANEAESLKIAKLFEKAGRCSAKGSIEREQLLTRAALVHYQRSRFTEAEKILSKVQPQDAFSSRPLYWYLRTELQLQKRDKAKKILDQMQTRYRFSFHSLLAGQQFGRFFSPSTFEPGPLFPTRSQRTKKANAFIEQVELCHKYRQRECANAVAEYIFEKYPKVESQVKCYVAGFAAPPIQIRNLQEVIIARSDLNYRNTLEMLYPRPNLNEFESQKSTIDPAILFAVARRESQFDPKSTSIADAFGLMQIVLPTARRFQPNVDREGLYEPKTNVSIGAMYLKELMGKYSGSVIHSLAAYNAGEESVARWTARYNVSDPILFLDLIPYRETRDYVGYVLSNYFWYRRLYYADATPLVTVLPSSAVAVQSL